MPLTDIAIRNAGPREKPRKLSDMLGLYLLISPAGGKTWYMKYKFAGSEKKLRIGAYPSVSLRDARKRRDDVGAIDLARKPALTMTPEGFAERIEKAARDGRQADHYAWDQAQGRLESAARSIETAVASALEFRVQRYWIAGAAAAALVVGMVLGDCLPGWIDRAVPESWHWPEASAAALLGLNERDAGFRLLQVADPQGWQQVVRAITLLRENAQTVADCDARAARVKAAVICKVQTSPR